MRTAEARIPTDHAAGYLVQLCRHLEGIGAAGHETSRHGDRSESPAPLVEYSGHQGVIDFGWARCTLDVGDRELTLRAAADNPDDLQRLQDVIAGRVEEIGRRDHLAVTWTQTTSTSSGDEPRTATAIVDALITPAGRADPFPLYAAAHRLGPVAQFADGWYLVSGYAAVNQVLREPGFGIPEPAGERIAASLDGEPRAIRVMSASILRANPPDHSRMRSLISQVFTPRRTAALRPAIEDAVDALLDRLTATGVSGTPFDFMDSFAFQLPVTVICELLGVPDRQRHPFRTLAADLTEALEPATDISEAAEAAARELSGYFTTLIAQRRAAPTDDLIGALVAARDVETAGLSETELLANLIMLLVAGFETTTNLLGNGLAVLLDTPALADAVRFGGEAETAAFVEEVLRYDSPVQLTTREAHTAGQIAETSIPVGSRMIVLIGAANRDPARYADPDRFDPARSGIKPLSFGAGPHICIGNSLARLEAAVAFPRLLACFPAIAAAPDLPPTRRDRLVLRGYEALPVTVD